MQILSNTSTNSRLEEFFITMLQEIYWSEIHLVNVLSTMTGAASNDELIQAFDLHRQQTEEHVKIVERAFGLLGIPAQAEPSVGLQGLFDEGWQVIDETEEGSAQRDVALIIAAQKVEHYEIACYGSLVTLAGTLGEIEVADTLRAVLTEEKETDATLTIIAESKINAQASEEPVEH
jgi:ferritin-like metal-binding protein YciE